MSERASLKEVLEFCNIVREAGAANPLDALLEAIPEESKDCLIARNLNFSCEVNADRWESLIEHIPTDTIKNLELGLLEPDDNLWYMMVSDASLALEIAESIGSIVVICEDSLFGPIKIKRIKTLEEAIDFTNNLNTSDLELFYKVILPARIAMVAIDFDHASHDPWGADPEMIQLMNSSTKFDIAARIVDEIARDKHSENNLNDGIKQVLSTNLKELGYEPNKKS